MSPDEIASADDVRELAIREFEDAPPLHILGAFFLPVDGRAGPVPVFTSTAWH